MTNCGADEIAAVKKMYAAINRNDIPVAAGDFAPDVEWIEPPDFPGAGTYRGLADVMANISKGRDSWAEGRCDVEGFAAAGDKLVVLVCARVRPKGGTNIGEGRFAEVFTFREGRIVQIRSFGERQDALQWAGVEGPAAPR